MVEGGRAEGVEEGSRCPTVYPQSHSVKQVTVDCLWQFLSVSRVSCRTFICFDVTEGWRGGGRGQQPWPAMGGEATCPDTRHLPHTHYSYTYELSEVYYPSMSSLALGNKSCQVSKLLLTTRIMTTEPKYNTGLMPLIILTYLQNLQSPRKYGRYGLGLPRWTYYGVAWQVYGQSCGYS